MTITRGEIWWADLREPRGSGPGFRRPIVIVQSDKFNQSRINTVIGAIVTTNLDLAKMPGNVLIKKGQGGLKQDSVANVTQVVTIDKNILLERIGSLSSQKLLQIEEGLRLVLSL
jgi:mRNA interferase MazF